MKRLFLLWTLIFSFISVPGLALIHDVAHPFHAHLHDHQHSHHDPHTHTDHSQQQAHHDHHHHLLSGFHDALETWLCELYEVTSTTAVTDRAYLLLSDFPLYTAYALPSWVKVYSPGFYPDFWGRAPPLALI